MTPSLRLTRASTCRTGCWALSIDREMHLVKVMTGENKREEYTKWRLVLVDQEVFCLVLGGAIR